MMAGNNNNSNRRPLVTATGTCWMRPRDEEFNDKPGFIDPRLLDGYRRYRSQEDNDNDGEDSEYYRYDQFGGADAEQEEQQQQQQQQPTEIPIGLRDGDELDVRIVKVEEKYALCRPIDYPKLKGKISIAEMDEFEIAAVDARFYVRANTVYRASVLHMVPPDKMLLSLKRVRRVLKDDFQPFTICLFNVPYDLDTDDIKNLMTGVVLDVSLSAHCPLERDHLRSYAFVTFLHQTDAMAAIRQWNINKMPLVLGNETYHYRIRAKRAHTQRYRQELQDRLDEKMYEKLELWTETPDGRRARQMAERDLRDMLPYYYADRDHQQLYDHMGFSEGMAYSIKNNPRPEHGDGDDDAEETEH
jgi:hypothetical protein